MLGLYVSLALLGLAAIDPVGIGVMPILLAQKRPYKRSFVFLGGSFVALMLMGLVFAKGFGQIVLHFEQRNHWFVPGFEAVGGVILLVTAVTAYVRVRVRKATVEPSEKTREWLELGNWQLFGLGALLVAVQSIIDVVFVVAMVRVGQFQLSNFALVGAITIYAFAALLLQLAVVIAFRFAPSKQKEQTLQRVHDLLTSYGNQALIGVSLVLGCLLLVMAIR